MRLARMCINVYVRTAVACVMHQETALQGTVMHPPVYDRTADSAELLGKADAQHRYMCDTQLLKQTSLHKYAGVLIASHDHGFGAAHLRQRLSSSSVLITPALVKNCN